MARRPVQARRALVAAALGWMLDAFDVMLYALVLPAVLSALGLSATAAACSARSRSSPPPPAASCFGVVADRFGRTRALMRQHPALLGVHGRVRAGAERLAARVFRVLLGLGMGGEWASGAALVVRDAGPPSIAARRSA